MKNPFQISCPMGEAVVSGGTYTLSLQEDIMLRHVELKFGSCRWHKKYVFS